VEATEFRLMPVTSFSPFGLILNCASSCRRSATAAVSASNSLCSRDDVSAPTAPAKPHRMTSVSSAEPPARRQRIGMRLSAEDVACA